MRATKKAGPWLRRLTGTVALAICGTAAIAGEAAAQGTGAPLSEPQPALEQALECSADVDGAARTPVILVHGTGSTPEESFSFGYQAALPKQGIPVCTVRLPERATVDLQRSIQYVVHAIREVARRSGRRVSLVGHSQGALLATYAPQFWPDLPAKVDDVVGLAGPYQGTQRANQSCADGRCPVTSWQFRMGSNLNRAFMSGPRPAGPSFTAVATAFDELVTPAPDAARLDGATNVVIQDLCPGRTVDHFAIVGDAVAYALALDAITRPGSADPARFDPRTCAQGLPPGADTEKAATNAPLAIGNATVALTTGREIEREPDVVCPFDARACAAGRAGSKPESMPRLRLTRTCIGDGRLRVNLRGDERAVDHVNFKFDKHTVARDARASFVKVVSRRSLARTRARRLRAVAYTRDGRPLRVILARSLPRCGL